MNANNGKEGTRSTLQFTAIQTCSAKCGPKNLEDNIRICQKPEKEQEKIERSQIIIII